MSKITISQLNKIETLEDLEALQDELGRLDYEIGYRGGHLGFNGNNIAGYIGVDESDLSNGYGCGCNYLGGGLRGSIFASGYNKEVTGRKAQWLNALADACIRVYNWIEQGEGLQAEEDADGETNWDNVGTKSSRNAGIVSAY